MIKSPSKWLIYCLDSIEFKEDTCALDLACGKGRNSKYLEKKGYNVIAIDISQKFLNDFQGKRIKKICKDIEDQRNWPFHDTGFEIVLVTNFLNRSIFPCILNSVRKGGYLIYETFSEGNEKYGRPNNKNYILRSEELLKITKPFKLICYENIEVENYISSFVKQKIFVRNV